MLAACPVLSLGLGGWRGRRYGGRREGSAAREDDDDTGLWDDENAGFGADTRGNTHNRPAKKGGAGRG